jgi:DNA-binding Xre family transcriptional regulator
MSQDILTKLSTVLRKKMKKHFNTNVEFAYACDVNEKTIRNVLLGKQNISLKLLHNICDALEIKMSDLLKEIGQ